MKSTFRTSFPSLGGLSFWRVLGLRGWREWVGYLGSSLETVEFFSVLASMFFK